jgi:hypothetical protein
VFVVLSRSAVLKASPVKVYETQNSRTELLHSYPLGLVYIIYLIRIYVQTMEETKKKAAGGCDLVPSRPLRGSLDLHGFRQNLAEPDFGFRR